MASAKGRVIEAAPSVPESRPTAEILNEVVFCALPTPLFLALSAAAAKRQQTLAQFLAEAVSAALEKPLPPSLLTEDVGNR